mgnify:CR=1 FL=1
MLSTRTPTADANFMHDPTDMGRKLGNVHVELDLIDFMVDSQD